MCKVDTEILRKAILKSLQYMEGVKYSAPLTEPERETIERREDSLLQCLEHDPEHESVAEMIVYEYERMSNGDRRADKSKLERPPQGE